MTLRAAWRQRFHAARGHLVLAGALFVAWRGGLLVQDGTLGVRVVPPLFIAAVAGPSVVRAVATRLQPGALALEVPLLFLLASTLVFRERSAADLAYDPLDSAAQIRVACVGVAMLLGLAALLRDAESPAWRRPVPMTLYAAYVVVVFLGALESVNVPLTAYRGVELLTAVVVVVGAHRVVGADATRRLETFMYRYTVVLATWVWLGIVLYPGRALARPLDESIRWKWELTGVYPSFAANGVGALGAVLAAWSFARLVSRTRVASRRTDLMVFVLGIATVIGAQYRTGYVAVVVAILVIAAVRRPVLLVVVAFALAFLVVWNPSFVSEAEPYALRGQSTTEARQLSGRVDYWKNSTPVWHESPWIGRGLLTATRFEVLAATGNQFTAGVHSTWVEALVGTGLVGVGLLASAMLLALYRATRAGPRAAVPLALLVVLLVRSLTGNTFEALSYESLLFLMVVSSGIMRGQGVRRAVERPAPPVHAPRALR
jgi:O-antigen ligase